ncbi:MAG: 2TM domain-containing protein [Thermoplasmatota archaeon]
MAAHLTDEQVSKMAKARVGFKVHLIVYVLVNLFLMAIWMVTSGGRWMMDGGTPGMDTYYWPMWTHLGWGLGVAIHGFMVYGPGNNMLAREEEKIRQQMGK